MGEGNELAKSELRASHEDRDQVVEQLRVAAGDGRLSSDELDQRLEAALTAKTYGELAILLTDLPAIGSVPAPLSTAEPKDLVRIDCHDGRAVRNGSWIVPQRMDVELKDGHVTLDFTTAVITQRVFRLNAVVRDGSITLITRPGIVVDTDDVTVRDGGVKVRAPWGAGAPEVLRVEISGKVRDGRITARPPRRTFWQWLTRRPGPYALPR